MISLPVTIPSARAPIAALTQAASRMPPSSKALWRSRLSHLYGDMGGQRAVELTSIATSHGLGDDPSSRFDFLIGLETYFAVICEALAISALQRQPAEFLADLSRYTANNFRVFLDGMLSGQLFEENGVFGGNNAFDFAWVSNGLSDCEAMEIQTHVAAFAKAWEGKNLCISGIDPLQRIHHSLFPKNLLHITGQFYSPEWLAKLLLSDIGWHPEARVIDPFCGSGIFLLCALSRSLAAGYSIAHALHNICGIDLNPTACVAARCNIVMLAGRHKGVRKDGLFLNILCADALAPSIVKGHAQSLRFGGLFPAHLFIDGEAVPAPKFSDPDVGCSIQASLTQYGLPMRNWFSQKVGTPHLSSNASTTLTARDRRIWEQLAVFYLTPADMLVTNPPWVGWEYISRPYRDAITPAWLTYDLFKARGLDAAFLKEDLSSLALLSAWDLYLREKGRSAVILRPAVMRSDLAAKGVRRLSLCDDGMPLCLEHIREFSDIRVFPDANTDTATWQIVKGAPTEFPVRVTEWKRSTARWSPDADTTTEDVLCNVRELQKSATRTNPQDTGSRWLISLPSSLAEFSYIQGSNGYTPRMGVFTGGANGVFYMRRLQDSLRPGVGSYENITERAKRAVPITVTELETALVFSVLRGRDITMWHHTTEVYILCPHSEETRLYPFEERIMRTSYPLSYKYLSSMAGVLRHRNGFAGWERKILNDYFYTLQRVGEYTFARYKVCWKYISSEFTVCVVDGDKFHKPIIPNDKVMFVPFEQPDSAYFLCGLLSSTLIRNYINSSVSHRQISTNVIKSLSLPAFDKDDHLHCVIAQRCREGHAALSNNQHASGARALSELNEAVEHLYGVAKRSKRL